MPESETWNVAYYVSLDKFIVLSRSGATETNEIRNNIIPDLRTSAAGMHWIVAYVYSVRRKCVQFIVAAETTIRTVRDVEPRTATSTFTQSLNSDTEIDTVSEGHWRQTERHIPRQSQTASDRDTQVKPETHRLRQRDRLRQRLAGSEAQAQTEANILRQRGRLRQ